MLARHRSRRSPQASPQPVSDRHAWEALLSTVGSWHGMSSQARDQREVHTEGICNPVHCGGAFLAKDLRKVWTASTTSHRVIREDLWAVCDLQIPLRTCERTIDAACGLRTVATEERVLVDHDDLDAMLHDRVSCGEATVLQLVPGAAFWAGIGAARALPRGPFSDTPPSRPVRTTRPPAGGTPCSNAGRKLTNGFTV